MSRAWPLLVMLLAAPEDGDYAGHSLYDTPMLRLDPPIPLPARGVDSQGILRDIAVDAEGRVICSPEGRHHDLHQP